MRFPYPRIIIGVDILDAHAHLNFPEFDSDLPNVLDRMSVAGVTHAIIVGTDIVSSERAVKLALQYDQLYASVGLHPGDVPMQEDVTDLSAAYQSLARSGKVVAIGEVGLDFHYIENDQRSHAHEAQQRVLSQFVTLADSCDLPLIFHCRDASHELLSFFEHTLPKSRGVIHCFDGDYQFASTLLDLGFDLSFTAMITYPKNQYLREVVQKLPHTRVLLETDSPFLPPQGRRGKRNEPAYMIETVQTLADLWGISLEDADRRTSQNTKRVFRRE